LLLFTDGVGNLGIHFHSGLWTYGAGMVATLFWMEKALLIIGIVFVLIGVIRYGKRSQDWRGIVMMCFKRIPMTIEEYRRYRLGIALIVLAVLIRIILLTLRPAP
jgi:hypothetical protein